MKFFIFSPYLFLDQKKIILPVWHRKAEITELFWIQLCISYDFDTMVIFERSVFDWCRHQYYFVLFQLLSQNELFGL